MASLDTYSLIFMRYFSMGVFDSLPGPSSAGQIGFVRAFSYLKYGPNLLQTFRHAFPPTQQTNQRTV